MGHVDEAEKGKAISGTVRYPWGTVAGAIVATMNKSVVSDADGKYRIRELAPGVYTLACRAPFPGYEAQPKTIEVSASELNAVDIFLDFEKAILEGTVCDQAKKPVNGAVVLGVLCGKDVKTTTTDSQGHFRFDEASPGHQFIRVNAKGFMGEVRDLQVRKDETTTADFELKFAPCKLHGTVIDSTGQPLRAEIVLRKGDVIIEKTASDETGHYEFSLLPGIYGLQARAPEYGPQGWRGEVMLDTKVDLKLSSAFGT